MVAGWCGDRSLYDFSLAACDTFDQSQARGFIGIFGLSSRIAAGRDLTK